MNKRKTIKYIATFFLILFAISPILFLLIYPKYNDILITIKNFDPYRISQEKSISLLTAIAPPRDRYAELVLGATSIEESLQENQIVLDRKLLEELQTKITIKDINVEGQIFQGESSKTMDNGFWHFPISKFPGEKGNVVIIGHRYLNLPPAKNTFYNLDKVKIGDHIDITHTEGEFTYIVVEIKEVEPNDMTVIEQSDDYRLTLITCTPLWTSEKRLAVIAKLDKLYKKV
jgi:sortase A